MRRQHIFGFIAAWVLVAASSSAFATTYQLTCNDSGSDHLNASLLGLSAWTSPASTAAVATNDVVELTGICQGDIEFLAPITLNITNRSNSPSVNSSDGVDGQLRASSTNLILSGITLLGTHLSANSGGFESGIINATNSSLVTLANDQVGPGAVNGVYAIRNSQVYLFDTTISGNGTAKVTGYTDGIRADMGALIATDDDNTVLTNVNNNTGNGVTLLSGSHLDSSFGTFSGNGDCATFCGSQIVASGGSTVHLSSATVAASSGAASQPPLIQILRASSALIEASLIHNAGGAASGAIMIGSASSLQSNTSAFTATGLSRPVIEATGSSSVLLAGGNTITASGTGGSAIQIDHSSSLQHQQATSLGYGSNATEAIVGAGSVQVQSSMDLGQGLISSNPSISWNLNGSALTVQQNSSFRLSGGVAISNGNVRLQQGSNGFFNAANGGTNAAGIVCVSSANDPGVHVTGTFTGTAPNQTNTSVTPNFPVYTLNDIMTGVSGATHPSQTNACLSF